MTFQMVQASNKNILKSPSKFGFWPKYGEIYALLFLCSCFLVSFTTLFMYNHDSPTVGVLRIIEDSALHTTSEKFLSIALDTSIMQKGWRKFDLDSADVVAMVSALSPAYLRFGGTAADCLIFDSESTRSYVTEYEADGGLCGLDNENCESYNQNISMTEREWLKINNFTKSAGLDLLFDLNVLLRNGENWDPSNALKLIRYSHKKGLNLFWQLGNEPNLFYNDFNKNVSGTQLAKDFRKLRRILDEVYEIHVPLVGPDVTRIHSPNYEAITYLMDFMKEIKRKERKDGAVVDAITWHHYYLNGRISTPKDFIDFSHFEDFDHQAQLMVDLVSFIAPGIPVWLTETSDAYGGGAPNITDRFVGGFMWLDKLGVAAVRGMQVVARQTIFGGYYALIDKDLQPLPDFWLSVLHKKLVGPKVLSAHFSFESQSSKSSEEEGYRDTRTLRFYCQCTPPKASSYNQTAAITIFGLNVGAQYETVKVVGFKSNLPRHAYILSGEHGLQSQHTLLNGDRLEMGKHGKLPIFNPVKEPPGSAINFPPYSMGFWVYHGVNTSVCA